MAGRRAAVSSLVAGRALVGAVVGVVIGVLVGCSSSAPAPGSAGSATPSGSGVTAALSAAAARAALLTAADLGPKLRATGATAATVPFPCTPHAPPLDQVFRPAAKSAADFVTADRTAEIGEQILVYRDDATAVRALAAGSKGLSCASADVAVAGKTVRYRIDGPRDYTTDIDVATDDALGWTIRAPGATITLIAARVGPQLVVVTLATSAKADLAALPSGRDVVDTALRKVLRHL